MVGFFHADEKRFIFTLGSCVRGRKILACPVVHASFNALDKNVRFCHHRTCAMERYAQRPLQLVDIFKTMCKLNFIYW